MGIVAATETLFSPTTINLATPITNNRGTIMLRWEDIDDAGNNHGLNNSFSMVPVVNNPPAIALPGSNLAYTENAGATVIDSTATATDSDSANFDTGTLTVNFTAGSTADDRLAIRHEGNSAAQIGIDGRIVKYGGTQIGTFTGGTGTAALVVTLNASATPAAAQALLRNITYNNISDNPATASHTGAAQRPHRWRCATSNTATKTINLTAVNDAPIVGAAVTRYDGSLNTLPGTQGWTYLSLGGGTQSVSGGATTLDTTGSTGAFAGYFSNGGWTPVLDRTTGYTINFTAQVLSEDRPLSGTADKNGDGIGDRAGFSLIALSSDKKGVELGFWQNEI